jgi:hypothetical protein
LGGIGAGAKGWYESVDIFSEQDEVRRKEDNKLLLKKSSYLPVFIPSQ